jgi:hypothetical protein
MLELEITRRTTGPRLLGSGSPRGRAIASIVQIGEKLPHNANELPD